MIVNAKMTALLQEVDKKNVQESHTAKLLDFLWPEFININGCIVLAQQLEKSHVCQENFEDATAYEAFVNHVHLNDTELGEELNPLELLNIAMKITEIWQQKLARDFSDDKFLIILGFDEDENEATLRFHKVRDSQFPWINLEGIDKYAEPIMVIEVG